MLLAVETRDLALPKDGFKLWLKKVAARPYEHLVGRIIDPSAVIFNLEQTVRRSNFNSGHSATRLWEKGATVPADQRRLEEWGGEFQNGLLIPTEELREHPGKSEMAAMDLASCLRVVSEGWFFPGDLEKIVNLGTLLSLAADSRYHYPMVIEHNLYYAKKAYAVADTVARGAASAEAGPNPSMQTLESVNAKYAPFHKFLNQRRAEAVATKLFPQEEIDKAQQEEKRAIEENGEFLKQRLAQLGK